MKRKLIQLVSDRKAALNAATAAKEAGNQSEYDSQMEKVRNLNGEIEDVQALITEQERSFMAAQPSQAERRDMAAERGTQLMNRQPISIPSMEIMRDLRNAVTIGGTLVQPTGADSQIHGDGPAISSILDMVQVEDLTGRVTAGSVLKAHNFVMYAYNNNDKITDKANRVVRFLVNLSLNENELAERGPVRVYVRVTDPDGNLLSDGRGTTFTFGGETLEATASREVDYQGKEVDLGIYVNNVESFKKGIYTVNAYTTQAQLGHGELLLR